MNLIVAKRWQLIKDILEWSKRITISVTIRISTTIENLYSISRKNSNNLTGLIILVLLKIKIKITFLWKLTFRRLAEIFILFPAKILGLQQVW